MAITPEALEQYWAANPQALQQAVASNPSAFSGGLLSGNNVTSAVQPGMTVVPPTTTQAQRLPQSTTGLFSNTQAPAQDFTITDELLEQHWRDNPAALEQAIKTNPLAFATKGLQDSFGTYQSKADEVNQQSTLRGMLAGEDFAYVPGGRVQGVLTGGAFLPESMTTQRQQSENILGQLEEAGVPRYKDIDGQRVYLNTGFQQVHDGYVVNPPEDAPVGEYSVVGMKRDTGPGPGDLVALAASLANPLGALALAGSAAASKALGVDVPVIDDVGGGILEKIANAGDLLSVGSFVNDLVSTTGTGRSDVYNPNVEQQAPDIVTDIIGPGGMFDLSVLDRPAAPSSTVPEPVEPTETTTTDGGGGGGDTTADTAAEASPVNETPVVEDVFGDIAEEERRESMEGIILGTINDAGQMVLNDGRVVSAPPGNWQPGDLVPEHREDTTSDVPFDLTGLESVFDTTDDLEDIAEPTTPTVSGDPSTGTTGDIVDAIGDILGGTTGAAVVGDIIGDLLDGIGSGGGTGSGTGTGDGTGDGDGSGTGSGGLSGGATRLANAIKFEPFMAQIDFFVPLLQRLNIPVKDFVAALLANKDK